MSDERPFWARYSSTPCTRHDHPEPRPCVPCCYTDNGYCACDCHSPGQHK